MTQSHFLNQIITIATIIIAFLQVSVISIASKNPSKVPTIKPSKIPTRTPSTIPTKTPTITPSKTPSTAPNFISPTLAPFIHTQPPVAARNLSFFLFF